MARQINVGDRVNCPYRGGDREGFRGCEYGACAQWEWTTLGTSGFCNSGYTGNVSNNVTVNVHGGEPA